MYPDTMQKIGAEQGRQMREQAAAWRNAQSARGAGRPQSARISFAFVARLVRESLAGQGRLHGTAAA